MVDESVDILNAAEKEDGSDGHILWYGILPIRNCYDTVRDAVITLVNQTRPPGRVVVIDDGSTDGTGEILDELAEKHPGVIVHHTGSETRDYSRLPRLWNLGIKLGGPGKYHFYGNGDCTYEPDYMEQLLDVMERDPDVVNAGGVISGEKKIPRVPHGAGTLVREQWMFDILGKPEYPVNLVYEALAFYYALMVNRKVVVVKTAIMHHHHPLGTYHRFGEWGAGMRALGYHPLYALGRCIVERRPHMLYHYLTFRPRPGTYWDYGPENLRRFVRGYQRKRLWSYIRQVARPRPGGTPTL